MASIQKRVSDIISIMSYIDTYSELAYLCLPISVKLNFAKNVAWTKFWSQGIDMKLQCLSRPTHSVFQHLYNVCLIIQ